MPFAVQNSACSKPSSVASSAVRLPCIARPVDCGALRGRALDEAYPATNGEPAGNAPTKTVAKRGGATREGFTGWLALLIGKNGERPSPEDWLSYATLAGNADLAYVPRYGLATSNDQCSTAKSDRELPRAPG